MKSTPLVNMSVDGFLGVGVHASSNDGSGDTDSKASEGQLIVGTGGFIIFVFTCIAATHSNSDSIYSACGHTLRNLLIADLVMPVVLIVVLLLFICLEWCFCIGKIQSMKNIFKAKVKPSELPSITVLIFVLFVYISIAVGAACLGGFSISESVIAMGNSDCMSAMSNTTDGINSPSANIGSPLLAIMAMIQGLLYCYTAFSFTVGIFGLMGVACFAYNQ
jgi:hypothetical protein